MTQSIEERLFTAYKEYGSVTLTWEDVASLVRDDAIGTRITNAAAIEAGAEQPGCDMIGGYRIREPWAQFKKRVAR